jgi:GTP-binding protein
VERTSVLLHLIDIYADDVAAAYKTIRLELASYSPELLNRPEVVALTKIDGVDDDIVAMQMDSLKEVVGKAPIFAISSSAHKGIKEVLRELHRQVVKRAKEETEKLIEEDGNLPVIRLGDEQAALSWHVTTEGDIFRVTGHKIEKFARRTDFSNFEGLNRLRDIMKKMGISHELRRAGAEGASIIQIGDQQFTFIEQK